MKCFLSHKFVYLNGRIVCEKCGIDVVESQHKVSRNILGQPRKSVIIKKEDSIDKLLEK